MFESNYNFNVSNIPINHAYQYTKMIFLKKKILKLSYIQVIELLYKYIVMFIIMTFDIKYQHIVPIWFNILIFCLIYRIMGQMRKIEIFKTP